MESILMKMRQFLLFSCLLSIVSFSFGAALPSPEDAQVPSNYVAPYPQDVSDHHFYVSIKAGGTAAQISRVVHHGGLGSVESYGKFQGNSAFGLGIGHAFRDWMIPLRFELDYTFFSRNNFFIKTLESSGNYNNKLSITTQPVVLNIYYDHDLNAQWSIFAGPGGGISHTRVRTTKVGLDDSNSTDFQRFNNEDSLEFVWALSAGVARDVGQRGVLSLMYRFLDNGRLATGTNQSDGTEAFSARLRRHVIMAAFDYYY